MAYDEGTAIRMRAGCTSTRAGSIWSLYETDPPV